MTLNNVGSAYTGLGEFQKALDTYTAALEINRALENDWNVSINLNNIAWVYGQLGDRPHALKFYQESLELIRKVNDQRRMATTLNNIGDDLCGFGRLSQGARDPWRGTVLRRATGDADGEANLASNLGKCLRKVGANGKRPRDHMERAVAIHRTSGKPLPVGPRSRATWAVFDRDSGDLERARSRLERGLEISRPSGIARAKPKHWPSWARGGTGSRQSRSGAGRARTRRSPRSSRSGRES